ncbi:methyltransferase, FxLD system [Promicromonospora panici]|uniref:methyltransferase, FxLD system n=1 Tax=Promicromonospora panici TaxID=2219658 RepID=UPI00101DB558|nr:methyltransferase, FxLD system [Promicromonospora panici]
MTQTDARTGSQAEAASSSDALRERMIAELIESGVLTDPAIEAAFRAVPREVFAPAGTPAELPYAINDVVETRFSNDGRILSSLSAPVMHAGNLHQARIQEGQRVLEIGSGGPNAAMLAHLVGPSGHVVSVDIDEGVTARTRAGLERLGLADRVEIVTVDAFEPLGRGLFDRIMVTVSPWSLPQTWVEQLAPDGILVVPLGIAPGLQRVIGLRKRDGRLISESTVPGGFVPLQGTGLFNPPSARLTGPSGKPVTFRFTSEVPEQFGVSDNVLASDPVEAWSGVTYENGTIWLDLLTFLLVQPGACSMEAEDPADRGSDKSFYPALVDGASFAALHRRPATDTTVEVGAIGKGPDAKRLTRHLADTIAWYGAAHRGTEPLFQWWPTSTEPGDVPPSVTVLPRPHGTLTLSWPVAEQL